MVLNNDTDPVEFAIQSWIMYSVGIAIIVLRMAAQLKRHGFKGLQIDDYVMCLSACLYTVMVVTLIDSVSGVGGNGFPPDVVAGWTDAEKADHVNNAKLVQVAEQATLTTIYSVKACMLLIYGRLTMGLKERLAVKILAGYTFLGFVATEIAMFTLCMPYDQYWVVPTNDLDQCSFYRKYSIAQAVFNISSDSLMLAIPLPLLIRSRLPIKQKVAMVIIFGMGLFVVLSAIMSKTFALLPQNIENIVYAFWYLREASVAVYVANLPLLWPMIRALVNLVSGDKDTTVTGTHTTNTATYELKSRKMRTQRLPDEEGGEWDGNSSQERIVDKGVILKHQTFDVQVTEDKSVQKQTLYDQSNHGGNIYNVGVDSNAENAQHKHLGLH